MSPAAALRDSVYRPTLIRCTDRHSFVVWDKLPPPRQRPPHSSLALNEPSCSSCSPGPTSLPTTLHSRRLNPETKPLNYSLQLTPCLDLDLLPPHDASLVLTVRCAGKLCFISHVGHVKGHRSFLTSSMRCCPRELLRGARGASACCL